MRRNQNLMPKGVAFPFRLLLLLIMYILFFIPGVFASGKLNNIEKELWQTPRIEGRVMDENKNPLSGVTVQVKGTTKTTLTDADGNFAIEVSEAAPVLVFTYVGKDTKEVRIKANSPFLYIQLDELKNSLSEVVVVGYGTEKRVDLTGAVSTVSSKTLLERPANNASDLLEGRIAGLQVTQPSGAPGTDDGILQIRGLGSFGASSAPLVLVDGVVGSLTDLAPGDIENITVLKDASSASIYGARAANGVILVTTKRASMGSTIEYRVDLGRQSATTLPKLIYNSAEYMTMYDSALTRSGMPTIYTQAQIDAYANAKNNPQFPNFNWMDYYFNPATSINHYLSVSNSNEKTSYKFSLNYLNEDGILPDYNFKRYNAQFNLNSQVTKAIQIGTIIGMVYKDVSEPPGGSDVSEPLHVIQAGPTYGPVLPDGSGRLVAQAYPNEPHNATSPLAFSNGATYNNDYALNAQFYVNVNLIKGLVWSTKAAVYYLDSVQKNWKYSTLDHYYYQKLPGQTDYSLDPAVTSPGAAGVTDYSSKSITPTVYSTLTYDTRIGGNHNIKAMVGYEQESNNFQYLSGTRLDFPDPSLTQLNAGNTSGQTNSGDANAWALRSYFGRVAYNFKDKYLFEANARYDGTSRVSPKNRWGLFPSVSGGWKISEENFMKNKFTWIDNLKLRGSLGVLGNQAIGNYSYQDIFSFTQYSYGSTETPGVILTNLTDPNLRWESTRILDFGLDMDIYKNLFGITVDWFKKNTYDILATLPVPASLGLIGPVTNDGELQNMGWEIELRHSNKIGEFSYNANFLFSTYKNKLLSIATPTLGINQVGLPYNSFYLYQMIGIFQSQDEINKSPKQVFFAPHPGDIKIKDQNGDGVVDAKDRVSYNPYPAFTYSFGLNVGWRAFDLSVFLQGVAGLHSFVYGWGWEPFVQGDPPLAMFKNAWSPTNPSNTIPAVYVGSGSYAGGYGGVKAYQSTYELQNASYMRIKSIKLSYTIAKRVTDRIKSKGVSIYISGDNLFTFTKYPAEDPERAMTGPNGGRAFYYPQVRTLNAGLDIKF